MTRAERLKLAKAARELAMECVAGTAPQFGTGMEFYGDGSPCCALGHVLARAGFRPSAGRLYAFSDRVGKVQSQRLVSISNDHYDVRDAIPWALLSLADELDASHD